MSRFSLKNNQTLSYLFWCIMTTAVSWLSYSLYVYLFGLLPIGEVTVVTIGNVLSWITAVTFSFTANKIRVFKSKSWKPSIVIPEILKFYSTRLAVGFLEMGLVPVLVSIGLDQKIWGVDGMLAKAIVTPVVILLNYTFGRFFVFKKK